MKFRFVLGFLFFWLADILPADEIRPGYLEIRETSPEVYSVLWKVPAKGTKKLGLDAQLPANCINKSQPDAQLINAAYIQRWVIACEGGLVDRQLAVAGLESTNTDVLLRMEFNNGISQSVLLTPSNTSFQVP